MANRLFSPASQRNIGCVSRSLKSVLGGAESVREYSNHGWRKKNLYVEQVLFGHLDKPESTVWPDPNLGCLGPKDGRLLLPGNVGLKIALDPKTTKATPEQLEEDKKRMEDEISFWRNLCESPSNHQRQVQMLHQHEEVEKIQHEEMCAVEKALQEKTSSTLECKAHPCPDLLRRELAGLFVNVNMREGPLTVITLCQRTVNDMTAWSADMEEERDELIENFIKTATDICADLRRKSLWADFVEPNSGRPFYSPYTNTTFFETDERYRHLGFRVQDLGCCKVISHHKWGTHAFVGSIFTNAPAESEFIQSILNRTNGVEETIQN